MKKKKIKIDGAGVLTALFVIWFIAKIIFVIAFCAINLLKGTSFARSVFFKEWLSAITLLAIDFALIGVARDTNEIWRKDSEEVEQRIKNRKNPELQNVSKGDTVYVRQYLDKVIPITVTNVIYDTDKTVYVFGNSNTDESISKYTSYEMGINAFFTKEEALTKGYVRF